MEDLANWTRAELVRKLGSGYHGGLRVSVATPEKDGLIWSGSARSPGFVFSHGFQKPYEGTKHDPGEDVGAWAESIQNSITGNTRAWGFHFTTSPKVAAQFGAFHVANAPKPYQQVDSECADWFDDKCVRRLMTDYQQKYGCPAEDSQIWKKEACWDGKDCIRVDKLSDPDFGIENLCPNWGYAYVVKAEGIHVRVHADNAYGKDYSAEEEVFVPIGVKPEEVVGAIPIYARKSYDKYRVKNPGMINFKTNWDGPWGWKGGKMTVPAVHTKDGKGSTTAIGAFIFNPNYKGDAHAEIAKELAMKRIADDLGTAIPKEAP